MIVVASNDNESSQVTLPGFSIFEVLHVFSQWLRSLRLKMVKSSLTVWQFLMKRVKEVTIIYCKKNKFICKVSRIEKCLVKLKERIW